jgi:hypothetical protein
MGQSKKLHWRIECERELRVFNAPERERSRIEIHSVNLLQEFLIHFANLYLKVNF